MVLTKRYIPLFAGIVFLLSVGLAWGATPPTDTLQVGYFVNANTAGVPDGTVQMDNPGTSGANICAMVYVFDPFEEMSECCGCTLTPDDLRTLSVDFDLTANPLTGSILTTGVVKIVSSAFSGSCDPRSLTPTPSTRDWGTHIILPTTGSFTVTETVYQSGNLSSAEESSLTKGCGEIVLEGSGHGICSCGTGS
jgi:hypothetical protein